MKATVIGLGLIGGSFALSLKEKGLCDVVTGIEHSPSNAQKALELGLVERIVTIDEAIAESDLIVLATPVDTIPIMATKILNRISEKQIVMDMGSTYGTTIDGKKLAQGCAYRLRPGSLLCLGGVETFQAM